jgi:hypothetical protein
MSFTVLLPAGYLLTQKIYIIHNLPISIMRFLIRMHLPTEAGNKLLQDGAAVKNVEDYINPMNAEAAYFVVSDGERLCSLL